MKENNEYLIETDDGSTTLFIKEYDQAMHSRSGAYEESLLKHINPSGVLKKRDTPVNVLDIGFGLGYNILALVTEFIEKKRNNILNIISLEKERTFSPFMESISFNDSRDMYYTLVKKAYTSGEANEKNINISVKFGDARNIIKNLDREKFDAVFQDPFSPSKNPELWSLDYFKIIYRIMKQNGVMTTYSSAFQVRRALIEAGFHIGKGPSVGQKREGTIASPSPLDNELSSEEISFILNEMKSQPYRDSDLSSEREIILQRRLDEIKKLKTIR